MIRIVIKGSVWLREVRLISNSSLEFREIAAHSWGLAPVVDRSYCDSTIGLALRKDNDLYQLNSVITFDTIGSCVDHQNIGQI